MPHKTRVITAITEIPQGSRNKYEIDPKTGIVHLDRVLYSSVHYPADYGYIPDTKADDGDPLDILVMNREPTFPGCHIKTRVIGVLLMKDEKGVDEKLLGVPIADPQFEDVNDLCDLPRHLLLEIENFFNIYKELEGKESHVEGWQGGAEAIAILDKYTVSAED